MAPCGGKWLPHMGPQRSCLSRHSCLSLWAECRAEGRRDGPQHVVTGLERGARSARSSCFAALTRGRNGRETSGEGRVLGPGGGRGT